MIRVKKDFITFEINFGSDNCRPKQIQNEVELYFKAFNEKHFLSARSICSLNITLSVNVQKKQSRVTVCLSREFSFWDYIAFIFWLPLGGWKQLFSLKSLEFEKGLHKFLTSRLLDSSRYMESST